MASLYDEMYNNNQAFRDYVNNAKVVENSGDIKTIQESIGGNGGLTLKDKVLTAITKISDSQMSFLSNVGGSAKKMLVYIIFGIAFFCIIKFNLLKDIKKFFKELK